MRRRSEILFVHAGRSVKRNCHAIAERDRAGLIEKQHVHVARCLNRAPAHGENIALQNAIHSGNANGAKKSADRRRNQTNEQRNQNRNRKCSAGINSERLQCDADEQKNERQRREQNRQSNFVRRFLSLRTFDERDHAIEKSVAFVHRDANNDAIAQHARPARHRTAISATLPNDRRRFTRDGCLVHARDSFNDVAVRGNDVARLTNNGVALLQIRCRNFFFATVSQPARHCGCAHAAQCRGLRFAATFCHRFREIGKEHREPEPDCELQNETAQGRFRGKNADGRQCRTDHGDEHDRIPDHQARIEFLERVADCGPNNVPIKK